MKGLSLGDQCALSDPSQGEDVLKGCSDATGGGWGRGGKDSSTMYMLIKGGPPHRKKLLGVVEARIRYTGGSLLFLILGWDRNP